MPASSPRRGDGNNHTFEIDNNGENQVTWVAWGQHLVPGQPGELNDSYKVLFVTPPPPLPPRTILVGFEDHGDNLYNEVGSRARERLHDDRCEWTSARAIAASISPSAVTSRARPAVPPSKPAELDMPSACPTQSPGSLSMPFEHSSCGPHLKRT